jgi:hypothetical protein
MFGSTRTSTSADRVLWISLAIVSSTTSACELVLDGIPPRSDLFTADGAVMIGEDAGGVEAQTSSANSPSNNLGHDASAPTTPPPAMQGDPPGMQGNAPPDCENLSWYADRDADGYGVATTVHNGCTKPETGSWAAQPGDCDDQNEHVHPGQTQFFGAPYTTQAGADSYDYDCSGAEESKPDQALAPQRCGLFSFPMCGSASGYAKTPRSGASQNAYCGSTSIGSCVGSIAYVVCQSKTSTTSEPYLCH